MGGLDGGGVCREVTGGSWGGIQIGGDIQGASYRALSIGVVLRLVEGPGDNSPHCFD